MLLVCVGTQSSVESVSKVDIGSFVRTCQLILRCILVLLSIRLSCIYLYCILSTPPTINPDRNVQFLHLACGEEGA